MSYVVFDMDETLAELYSVYYFIASLRLRETNRQPIPRALQHQMETAYRCFVRNVVAEEVTEHPLGILRPGILDVMMELERLRQLGIIQCVIIYSNNSHLESLEFIRDLIHEYVGSKELITDCIHWHHPMRGEERMMIPGASNKTWSVLKNIMVGGNAKAHPSLDPKEVHFFDDLEHWNLKQALGENYHQVSPYTFKASIDRLSEIYENCIRQARVNTELLLEYVIELFTTEEDVIYMNNKNEIESILHIFREKTRGTSVPHRYPPFMDEGLYRMLEVVQELGKKGMEKRNDSKRRRGTRQRRRISHRGSSQTNRKRPRSKGLVPSTINIF